MSQRSDVSKMLGGFAGLGSTSSSTARLVPQTTAISNSRSTLPALSRAPLPPPQQQRRPPQQLPQLFPGHGGFHQQQQLVGGVDSGRAVAPAVAGATVGGKSTQSVGFLSMKCLEVLRKAKGPMKIQDVQAQLGASFDIMNDSSFLRHLSENPLVAYDPLKKTWMYKSPHDFLTSSEAMMQHIRQNGCLYVSQDCVNFDRRVTDWVNGLLASRGVRGIRATRHGRCKVFSAESGLCCDLYHPEKRCETCRGVVGVMLYPRAAAALENVSIDADVKALWHRVPPPENQQLAECKRGAAAPIDAGRKRRKAAGTRAPRVVRVANAHMYTSEELTEVLQTQSQLDSNTSRPC